MGDSHRTLKADPTQGYGMHSDNIDYRGADKRDAATLSLFSDRELIMAVLHRRYTGEAFVKVVRPYTETVVTQTTNGRQTTTTKTVECERVEYGHGMDLRTKFVEFDDKGKLVQIGEQHDVNY